MYLKRLSSNGIKGNKYWYSKEWNHGYTGDIALPNCTTYAVGEVYEESEVTSPFKMFTDRNATYFPNAKEFYNKWTGQKGIVPKEASIVCWGGTSDKYGHVAIVTKVEQLATNKWRIQVAQSHYKGTYFEVKTYTVEPNKKTSGIGYVYNGCCYVNVRDLRTTRNQDKSQVEVLVDMLSVRHTPNGSKYLGRYCPQGLYNILDTQVAGDYTWAKLDEDMWVALNDKDNWTKTYLITTNDDKDKEIAILEKQVNELQNQVALLADKITKVKGILS